MVQEEEIPESLEELKKEIEELEESLEEMGKSITVIPAGEKKEKPKSYPEGGGFSIKAVLVGYVVYIGVLIAMGFLIGISGSNDILELLVVGLFLSVPALNVALGQPLSSGTDFLDLVNKWLGKFNGLEFLAYLKPYGLLLVVGMLPAIIAGVVAGIISKDKAYGFAAGVFIWIIGLLISLLLIIVVPSIGINEDILSIIMDMVTCGYLSALFLAIFGILGGGMKQA